MRRFDKVARTINMIPIPPLLIKPLTYIGIGISLLLTGYVKGCTDGTKDFVEYKAKVAAIAEEQEKRTAERISKDRREKERADEDYKRTLARLERDNKRLRDSRTSFLPAPAPSASTSNRVTLDRSEFERALREYEDEVIGLLEEGDKGIAGLDTAKRWWQEQSGVRY